MLQIPLALDSDHRDAARREESPARLATAGRLFIGEKSKYPNEHHKLQNHLSKVSADTIVVVFKLSDRLTSQTMKTQLII